MLIIIVAGVGVLLGGEGSWVLDNNEVLGVDIAVIARKRQQGLDS